jgi:hypothetical protein
VNNSGDDGWSRQLVAVSLRGSHDDPNSPTSGLSARKSHQDFPILLSIGHQERKRVIVRWELHPQDRTVVDTCELDRLSASADDRIER